jgi:hypothetical protein
MRIEDLNPMFDEAENWILIRTGIVIDCINPKSVSVCLEVFILKKNTHLCFKENILTGSVIFFFYWY